MGGCACFLRGVAFTIVESAEKYIKVIFSRGEKKIKFIDNVGRTGVLTNPVIAPDPIPESYNRMDQSFYFLRGRQVLIGISRVSGTGSTSSYRLWASVGGTIVAYGTATPTALAASKIVSGDQTGANPDTLEFFGFTIDDSNSTSTANGKLALRDLSFLDT